MGWVVKAAGRSTTSSTISALLKAGMCACEVRNPSGQCCLEQVKMMFRKRIGLVMALTLLLSFTPSVSSAATKTVTIRVTGMT
jgi:hypothetical protein